MGQPGCNILIRYMALLFVPIGVGVMQYWICCVLGPVGNLLHDQYISGLPVVSWSSHLVHGERKVVGQTEDVKDDV